MDYFDSKIRLYKDVTGQSFDQFASLLGVNTSTLYQFMTSKSNTIRKEVFYNFAKIVRTQRRNLQEEGSLWPELFMPELFGVNWAYTKPDKMWHYSCEIDAPYFENGEWLVKSPTGDVHPAPSNFIRYHQIPRWPLTSSSQLMHSLLKQTETGWQKVNPLPWDRKVEMVKLNGNHHIPGNHDKDWFTELRESLTDCPIWHQ